VRADELILEHLKNYMAMTEAEWAGDFAGAVRHIDSMLANRKALSELSVFYTQPDDANANSGFYYWGIVRRKAYYQKLADRVAGTELKGGKLAALLPESAQFRLDPNDDGRFAGWYGDALPREAAATGTWRDILTTKPFYLQIPGAMDSAGHTYMGPMWYRFNANLPNRVKGKRYRLYVPTVESEAWVWVNGKMIGHRPYHEPYERPNEVDMDITDAVRDGANSLAIRVHTGWNAASAAGGFYSRLFIYSPNNTE
jgi:hypothetical protein